MNGEEFRSLLNSNSRETSEKTTETARLLNVELVSQMSEKLDENLHISVFQAHQQAEKLRVIYRPNENTLLAIHQRSIASYLQNLEKPGYLFPLRFMK